tara:strand:- start:47901 stop:48140 length:240 start_codon:yes stop_codon:yes gene_type:complete
MKGIRQKDAVYWTHNKSVACLKENWRWIIDVSGEFFIVRYRKRSIEIASRKSKLPLRGLAIENQLRTWQKEIPKNNYII